jgi:hypothetical protein
MHSSKTDEKVPLFNPDSSPELSPTALCVLKFGAEFGVSVYFYEKDFCTKEKKKVYRLKELLSAKNLSKHEKLKTSLLSAHVKHLSSFHDSNK